MQSVNCFKNINFDACFGKYSNKIGSVMNGNIYHEKQVKELCALHALNNLFQDAHAFTKEQLDSICYALSPDNWINPHKSLLGLGNYDINVIMAALQTKYYEAIWFDKRKDPGCLNIGQIRGFILNVPSDYKLGFVQLPLRRRHWVTICEVEGLYYNLDSKLQSPELVGREEEVLAYLREQLQCKDKELFLVVSQAVERNQLWNRSTGGKVFLKGGASFPYLTDGERRAPGVTLSAAAPSWTLGGVVVELPPPQPSLPPSPHTDPNAERPRVPDGSS